MISILLVEDDNIQEDTIVKDLKKHFGDEIRIETVITEKEFQDKLDEIILNPPNVVIMDVMIRWTDPTPDMKEPPEEVSKNGPFRAGFRCTELLYQKTVDIPVILYTVLGENDIENNINNLSHKPIHLSKDADPRPLIDAIEKILR